MLRLHRRRSPRALISLTPLIDVVFILLVFFMLASSFLEWRAIDLASAGPASAATSEDAAVLLELPAGGEPLLAGRPVSPEDLPARLRRLAEEDPARPLAIQPAAGVPLQRVVDAIGQAKDAGLEAVSLVRAAGG